jgi:hypothetical protein
MVLVINENPNLLIAGMASLVKINTSATRITTMKMLKNSVRFEKILSV